MRPATWKGHVSMEITGRKMQRTAARTGMARTPWVRLVAAAALGSAIVAGPALADCASDASVIRTELEEKGKALQAAGKRKAEPQVLCKMLRDFTAVEARWVKFLQDNKDWCQIPAEIAKRAETQARGTVNTRNKICQVAANGGQMPQAGPAPVPPQGSISSALGITTGYSLGQGDGKGVFDTLSGNALKR